MQHLTPAQLALLAVIGVVVGAINAIAGAGSLITFPALIAFGLQPLAANASNCIGVSAGNIAATVAFRRELKGEGPALRRMAPATILGSLAGGVLLLALPGRVFDLLAPLLVAIGSVLTLLQPWLVRRIDAHRGASGGGALFQLFIFLVALYGGYFGSGIGLLFFAALSMWFADRGAHRLDAMKTVLQALSNGCAGLLFCFLAPVSWPAVIALTLSGWLGGPLGVALARRIPARPLRIGIGVCGLAAAVLIAARTL